MDVLKIFTKFFRDARGEIVNLLRNSAKFLGGVLLSDRSYQQLLQQRRRAVFELTKHEEKLLVPGVVGVVFSKDRALQLYALLSSYFGHVANPAPLIVLYAASTDDHAKAYEDVRAHLVQGAFDVRFVREGENFRDYLLSVLAEISTKNVFFLVDDIVFIRDMDLSVAYGIDPKEKILSLRHGPHLRRSYTAGKDQMPPKFRQSSVGTEMLEFDWFEEGNEWSDPWSVDGQVLSTAEVRVLSRLSDFRAPNSYEGVLKSFNDIAVGRTGLCFAESRLLNLPINRVQDEVPNFSGDVSPGLLLNQWNMGMMLDTTVLDGHIPVSPHEEIAIKFMRRKPIPSQSGDRRCY